jgi:hypothetical protein
MKRSADGQASLPVPAATTSTPRTIALSASQNAIHARHFQYAPLVSWGILCRATRAEGNAAMESERTEKSATMETMSAWTDAPQTALSRTTLCVSRVPKSD